MERTLQRIVQIADGRINLAIGTVQAAEIFKDPIALTVYDEGNRGDEERWVTLGLVQQQHFLVVVHTYHDSEINVVRIRIIRARSATKQEIKQYEEG